MQEIRAFQEISERNAERRRLKLRNFHGTSTEDGKALKISGLSPLFNLTAEQIWRMELIRTELFLICRVYPMGLILIQKGMSAGVKENLIFLLTYP